MDAPMVSGDVEAGFGELAGPVIASGEGVEVAGGVIGAPRVEAGFIVDDGERVEVACRGCCAALGEREELKAPAFVVFGVGCCSCDVGEFGIWPLVGHGLYRPNGEGSCPDVVLRIKGVDASIPFEAEGLGGSVEEELVSAHAPDAIGLWLAEEGVFWVVEDVGRDSIRVELELDE